MRRGRVSLVDDPGFESDGGGGELSLVERARGGDLDAWRGLHDRHRPLVLGYLRKLGADEDEFQETFLRAFRAIDTFERGRPFVAWLITIARNVAIDARRRTKARPPMDDLARAEEAKTVERPDEIVAAAEHLERALASLDPFERRLLRLRHGEGKSVAEAAAALGCNENKVKNTMHRVLARFYASARPASREEDRRGLSH